MMYDGAVVLLWQNANKETSLYYKSVSRYIFSQLIQFVTFMTLVCSNVLLFRVRGGRVYELHYSTSYINKT